MKVLGVILAWTIVTGSQALVISEAPDPPSTLEELITKLERCVDEISSYPFVSVFWLADSKTSQAVIGQIEPFTKPLNNLAEELPTEITEAAEVVFGVPWGLVKKAHAVLSKMHERTYDESQQIIKALGYYLDPVILRVNLLTDPLLTTINMWKEEISQVLVASFLPAVGSLDNQLSFYVKSVQEVPEALLPLVVDLGKQVRSGLESLNKNLMPYLNPFLAESRKYREEFREWIEAPVFPPQKP